MIDLLLVSNDEFCPHLATMLMSVAASTPGPVRANIVTNDASVESRQQVARAVPSIEIRWLDCGRLEGLPRSTGGIDPISYGRLFGPGQLEGEVERLIYLDVDTLVRHDLASLWVSDLAGSPVGAVRDAWVTWVGHPTLGIPDYEALGFAARAPYFNAGVMVIDVQRWNDLEVENRCLEFLSNQRINRLADQDSLNAVFYGNWAPLPMRWNVFADPTKPALIELETSAQDVLDAQSDPAILHFASSNKPWSAHHGSDLLFLHEWQKFATSGPFSARYRPPPGRRRRELRNRLSRARVGRAQPDSSHVRHPVEIELAARHERSEEWHHRQTPHLLAYLCDLHGSDKGSGDGVATPYPWPAHSYADLYAQLFEHCRSGVKLIFECGIGSTDSSMPHNMGEGGKPGASLRVWRDYFPNADVVGADLDEKVLFEEPRIRTFQVDQTSPASVAAMWQAVGRRNFDLMIDDGLHEPAGGLTLFEHSIELLAPHGIYVIEDVHPDHVSTYSDYFGSLDYRASIVILRRTPGELAWNNLVVVRKPWDGSTAGPVVPDSTH